MTYGMKGGDANRQSPKNEKTHYESHTANTKYGMGDFYGTGIKAKIGKVREDFVNFSPSIQKKLKTPPKSLA